MVRNPTDAGEVEDKEGLARCRRFVLPRWSMEEVGPQGSVHLVPQKAPDSLKRTMSYFKTQVKLCRKIEGCL